MPDDVGSAGEQPLRHRAQWLGGGSALAFACDRCGVRCRDRAQLEAGLCRGTPAAVLAADSSHRLMTMGDVVFCSACGARAGGGAAILLAEKCLDRVANGTAGPRLNRMKAGRHPTKGHFIGEPVPLVARAAAGPAEDVTAA